MFGIGFSEMILIGVVVLIAVGPKRLPQLMKTVGGTIREIRRASNELRRTVGIDEMMRDADVRPMLRDAAKPEPKRPERRELTATELDAELPLEGVDVAEADYRARTGTPAPQTDADPASPAPPPASPPRSVEEP